MSYISVSGIEGLEGEIDIQGSKNACLPIIAASVLIKGITVIEKCPVILDVIDMFRIIEKMGGKVVFDSHRAVIDTTNIHSIVLEEKNMKSTRASILFMGSMAARNDSVVLAHPGGCKLGERPIDIHIHALESIGYIISKGSEYITAKKNRTPMGTVTLRYPSVGATQNAILASVLSTESTIIENAAREPEIIELQDFLNKAGANIAGAGTGTIHVFGVSSLHDVHYTLECDRIVAGTYAMAVYAVGGKLLLNRAKSETMNSVLEVLENRGCNIIRRKDSISIAYIKKKAFANKSNAFYIKTRPFPGFPTDMQPQLIAALINKSGTHVIEDKVFTERNSIVNELIHMNASIKINSTKQIVINGKQDINAADVTARDLRCGAGLVIAALTAKGISKIDNYEIIQRGYEDILGDLKDCFRY